ncbi:MAG: MurR/RpiR family transcriptional regulator [Pseudomonadota bacterium]
MDDTSVPNNSADSAAPTDTDGVLERLAQEWETLTPEAQKAARYVLENPLDVGVSTVREIAEAANVKPNTVVRMARQAGFEGYDDFRAPFREAIRQNAVSFPDRARWLQDIAKSGELGGLYADMVGAAIRNLEETFAGVTAEALQAAAEAIWNGREIFILGQGVNNANARNFAYLASTGMTRFHAIPRPGSTAVDDLAWATEQDTLIAMTCRPYRTDVIDGVRVAQEQGVTVIALSDSPASPIILAADHGFVVAADTPQFFPSSVSTIALLETLLSFVISIASDDIVERVERFHRRRFDLGIYSEAPE